MGDMMTGLQFQKNMAERYKAKGYWVYETPNKISGQPVDLILIKGGKGGIVELKVCSTDYFSFDRIEDNQISSIEYFADCGNMLSFFVFYFEKHNEVLAVYANYLLNKLKAGEKGISYKELKEIAENGTNDIHAASDTAD